MLYDLAKKETNKLLSRKLIEIALVYERYDQKMQKSKYNDSDDDLSILANIIKDENILDNSIIWLDKFNGFTSQEFSCIREMLKKCNNVSICLSIPELNSNNLKNIFYPIIETYDELVKIAKDENYILDEIFIKENDFRTKELQYLCDNYFSTTKDKYQGEQNSIEIYKASNIYEEVRKCALEISKLIREKNYRYNDIVIACSVLDEYSNYIEAIFDSYDIPFFISNKRSLDKHSLIDYIMSVLKIYDEKFSFDSVFSYIKSIYSDYNSKSISILENYVLEWDIKGTKTWNSIWRFKKDNSIYENEKLVIVNELRESITNRLFSFFSIIKNSNSTKEFLTALYNFLIDNNTYTRLQQLIKDAKKNQLHDYADELKQSWNIIMGAFNQIHVVSNDEKFTTSKFINLLKIAFSEYEIGVIPPSNDKVEIGNVNRTSLVNKKAYFILATNEPTFPNEIKKDGIISDKERVTLHESGIKLASDSLMQIIEQRLVIYEAISMPIEKLFISYSIADLNHKSRRPANLVLRILEMYEDIKEFNNFSNDDIDYIYTPKMGMEQLIKNKEFEDVFIKWCIENKYLPYMNLIDKSKNYDISKLQTSKLLYSDTINISISKLETFSKCPFEFFIKYGLKAKERDIFKLSPPDIGIIIHNILGHLLKNNITENSEIVKESKIVFESFIKHDAIFNRNERYNYLGKRILERVIFSYNEIKRQITKGLYEPKEFEVAFGPNKQLAPLIINTKDNKKIILQGRIDRVDIANDNGEDVFRIIDYKLSNKQLSLYKIKEGIDLQLALYLYAYYNDTNNKPGGMYYVGTEKPIIKVKGLIQSDSIESDIHNYTKLEGYTIDDIDIIKLNDTNHTTKSDVFSIKKQISKEKMDNMFKYINKFIERKTEEIFSFETGANPIKEDKFVHCSYCKYISICGFDIDDKKCEYRIINKKKDEEVLFDE